MYATTMAQESAVVAMPEATTESPTTGSKRRASEVGSSEQQQQGEETSNKKPRTSRSLSATPGRDRSPSTAAEKPGASAANDEGSEAAGQSPSTTTATSQKGTENGSNPTDQKSGRRIRATDERQRSKRLFGALFSGISKPAAGGDRVTKRRAEIEQRRHAEQQRRGSSISNHNDHSLNHRRASTAAEEAETPGQRQTRLAKLAIHRRREQIRVDERNMHTRHRNMLDEAQFLTTRAEPKLYYLPYDLTIDEEDMIEDQILEVKRKIEREVSQFEEEKRRRGEALDLMDVKDLAAIKNPVPAAGERGEEGAGDGADGGAEVAAEVSKDPPPDTGASASSMAGNGEPKTADGKPDDPAPQPPAAEAVTEKGNVETHPQANDHDDDDDGDHVVEGDEDTVIY